MKPYQDEPGPTIDFSIPISSDLGMARRLQGANVLITGGASGIGKACALAFLQYGAYVTVADVSTSALEATRDEIASLAVGGGSGDGDRLQTMRCDVGDWKQQLELFRVAAGFGPKKGVLDVVLACAGPQGARFSFDVPECLAEKGKQKEGDGLDVIPPPPQTACVEVNLKGVMYTAQLAVWYMARREASLRCLIMVGSITAYRGIAGSADYTAAKYGVRGLFKALRDAPDNHAPDDDVPALRVNMLCPGYVRTPFIEARVDDIQKAGARLSLMEALVDGVLRTAADHSIHGKAIGVSPAGNFDIRDDLPGLNGLTAVNDQVWAEAGGIVNRSRIGIW